MNIGRMAVILIAVVLMGLGVYSLNAKKEVWMTEAQKLNQELLVIQKDNQNFEAQLNYFKQPENLLKELKTKFNYREMGEKLIIVVPNAATTTAQ